jgi:PAS domain S-box-containing protein
MAKTTGIQTDQLFRLMVNSVTDYALFMLDREGNITTWNSGAEGIKLYTAEEIIGKHFSLLYTEEDINKRLPGHHLLMAEMNGHHEVEGWRVRKDGSLFWANVVITAMRDERDNLIGFAKITRDLSERRRAEQALTTAYDQLNSVLECTSDAVVKIDHTWRFVYGNRKAVKSLPDFELGKNYWDGFSEVRGTPLEQILRNAMRAQSEASYEIFYEPYQRWFRGKVYPTGNGLTIFFADITEEKVLQAELEQSRYLKEKRVEALGHMAGGLAHEINNPLAIIHAKANDLLEAATAGAPLPAETVQKACEYIVRTSDRAIRIIRGLKGFGRDADKDPMETASIYEIVDQCIELQGSRFERHKVELRLEMESDLPYIDCREAQIGQIITNLMNNAFDAVLQSQPEERYILLRVTRANAWLHVEVIDSGSGIDEKVKTHLMEPFFTTKPSGLGMGIGLSLSKAIAEEHGGALTLHADDPNTCFRLALPIVEDTTNVDTLEL